MGEAFLCEVATRADRAPDRLADPRGVGVGVGVASGAGAGAGAGGSGAALSASGGAGGTSGLRLLAPLLALLPAATQRARAAALPLPAHARRALALSSGLGWALALSPCARFSALLGAADVETAHTLHAQSTSTHLPAHFADDSAADSAWLRRLAWAHDSALLAVAAATGDVCILAAGMLLCTISASSPTADSDPSSSSSPSLWNALCALFFAQTSPDSGYSHKLVAVDFCGHLREYHINAANLKRAVLEGETKTPLFVRASDEYPRIIKLAHTFEVLAGFEYLTTTAFDAADNSLYVFGKPVSTGAQPFRKYKLLHEAPFYELVSDDLSAKASSAPSFMFSLIASLFKSSQQQHEHTPLVTSAETNSSMLAVLSSTGDMALYDKRNLSSIRAWTSAELYKKVRGSDDQQKDGILLSAITWWSDTHLALGFVDGTVSIAHAPSLAVALEDVCYTVRSRPQFACARDDRLFILERQDKTERYKVRGDYAILLDPNSAASLDADDEDDSSDRPASRASSNAATSSSKWRTLVGTITKPLTLLTDTFLWNWESDALSKPRIVELTKRHFRVICISKTTPATSLRRKIEAQAYEAALSLAARFSLNTDPIFQAQWNTCAAVTPETIAAYLDRISAREWVLTAALERVPPSIPETRLLLEYGRSETDGITQDDVDALLADLADDGDVAADVDVTHDAPALDTADLCKYRLVFLKYLARLDTFEELLSVLSAASDEEPDLADLFIWFRDVNLVDLAVEYAVNENFDALHILFLRHGDDLFPHRLAILESVPEVVDPAQYEHLLPSIDSVTMCETPLHTPRTSRDIVEKRQLQELLGWIRDCDNCSLPQSQATSTAPLTNAAICEWYAARCRAIDKHCGFVNNALTLTAIAADHGVTGLAPLASRVLTLCDYLYQYPTPDVSITLERFEQVPDVDVVRLFLADKTPAHYTAHFHKFVAPFLARRSLTEDSPYEDARMALFYEYLIDETSSTRSVAECRVVWETARTDAPIIKSRRDLASLTRTVAFLDRGAETADSLRDLSAMTAALAPASEEIHALNKQIACAATLVGYALSAPLASLAAGNAAQQRQLLVRAARVFNARRGRVAEGDWRALLANLLVLQRDGVLALMSVRDVYIEFVRAALSAGEFGIVRETIKPRSPTSQPPLDASVVEALITSTAREFYDNAESCSRSTGLMRLAWDCLHLIAPTPAVLKEIEFVDATDTLARLGATLRPGLELLPLQVRLCKDKLVLVESAIAAQPDAYARGGEILELAARLGFRSDRRAQVRVLTRLARGALDAGDCPAAVATCKRGIVLAKQARVHDDEHLWRVCAALAKSEACAPGDASRLLGHALTACPAGERAALVDEWRRVETSARYDALRAQLADRLARYDVSTVLGHDTLAENIANMRTLLADDDHDADSDNATLKGFQDAFATYDVTQSPAPYAPRAKPPAQQLEELSLRCEMTSGAAPTETLLRLCKHYLTTDVQTCLAMLLALDPAATRPFFTSLYPSTYTEALIARFYGTQLLTLLGDASAHTTPANIFTLLESPATTAKIDAITAPDTRARVAACIDAARYFSTTFAGRRTGQYLREINRGGEVDVARFRGDDRYAAEVLRNAFIAGEDAARESMCKVFRVLAELGLPSDKFVKDYVAWLVTSHDVSSRIAALFNTLRNESQNARCVEYLCALHGELLGNEKKAAAVYEYLFTIDPRKFENLGVRLSLTKAFGMTPRDAHDALRALHSDADSLRAYLQTRQRASRWQASEVAEFMTRIAQLAPVDAFPDEQQLRARVTAPTEQLMSDVALAWLAGNVKDYMRLSSEIFDALRFLGIPALTRFLSSVVETAASGAAERLTWDEVSELVHSAGSSQAIPHDVSVSFFEPLNAKLTAIRAVTETCGANDVPSAGPVRAILRDDATAFTGAIRALLSSAHPPQLAAALAAAWESAQLGAIDMRVVYASLLDFSGAADVSPQLRGLIVAALESEVAKDIVAEILQERISDSSIDARVRSQLLEICNENGVISASGEHESYAYGKLEFFIRENWKDVSFSNTELTDANLLIALFQRISSASSDPSKLVETLAKVPDLLKRRTQLAPCFVEIIKRAIQAGSFDLAVRGVALAGPEVMTEIKYQTPKAPDCSLTRVLLDILFGNGGHATQALHYRLDLLGEPIIALALCATGQLTPFIDAHHFPTLSAALLAKDLGSTPLHHFVVLDFIRQLPPHLALDVAAAYVEMPGEIRAAFAVHPRELLEITVRKLAKMDVHGVTEPSDAIAEISSASLGDLFIRLLWYEKVRLRLRADAAEEPVGEVLQDFAETVVAGIQ